MRPGMVCDSGSESEYRARARADSEPGAPPPPPFQQTVPASVPSRSPGAVRVGPSDSGEPQWHGRGAGGRRRAWSQVRPRRWPSTMIVIMDSNAAPPGPGPARAGSQASLVP